jgi:hypothetical protein
VKPWGRAGNGPGEFRQPHGIAVDHRGVIYVADRLNARLQRFDLDGKYLGEWSTGKILGYVESGRSHHVLNVTARGELLSGAGPDIVWWFHPAK